MASGTSQEVPVPKAKTVHRLELVPPARGRKGEVARQVVDVTLRTSDRMLLTVEEAAERLGVGSSTMYTLISNGEVASIHVGRLRRIEPAALTTFIARQRSVADDAPAEAGWPDRA
jgi:excisionase family DNA binding protein